MKIKLIACDVLSREMCLSTALSEHIYDITFLSFGLHSVPSDLRARIQSEIDAADDGGYDYIVLGYGLCSRGTADIVARNTPLVIPRAHDCITLFLGSRSRYAFEFGEHPGTYYYSAGWIERCDGEVEQGYVSETKTRQSRERYEEYVEKYGEDNAKFLIEQESQWLAHYNRAAFLNTGIGAVETYREFVERLAKSHSWGYEEIPGNMSIIKRLAEGNWEGDDFVIVQPGQKVVETFDQRVIGCGW